MADVIAEIAAERRRQIEVEGFTVFHDDYWRRGQLARAASDYAAIGLWDYSSPEAVENLQYFVPTTWPFDRRWWKPKSRRRDLIRAAALIVAEIERLDRAEKSNG